MSITVTTPTPIQGYEQSGNSEQSSPAISPVKTGGHTLAGVVATTLLDSTGATIIAGQNANNATALGNATRVAGIDVAGSGRSFDIGANAANQLSVDTEGQKATYSASINAHAPAATPTDWFTIRGSGSKTVRILSLKILLRATGAAQYRTSLIVYSAYLTGGTPAAVTIIPHDSSNAAATAVVDTWSGGLPAPGTPVGKIADDSLPVSVLGTPTFNNVTGLYEFGVNNGQSIVLRGTTQYLAVNSGGAALPGGMVADVRIVWTEE